MSMGMENVWMCSESGKGEGKKCRYMLYGGEGIRCSVK